MRYNTKSSRSIIYSAFDRFNIEGNEWESRAPEWITNGILEFHIAEAYSTVTEPFDVENYRCKLPCNLKLLGGISYNNRRLYRKEHYKTVRKEENYVPGLYSLTDNGWIYFDGIETGQVNITYKLLPFVYDAELNRKMPLVPDVFESDEALMWLCVRNLLYRGYKHPVLSLTSNNPELNPAAQWEKWKRMAKLAINRMDSDARDNFKVKNNSLVDFENVDFRRNIR